MSINYEEYINSSSWEKKRQERLKIDKHVCKTCGKETQLEIHHITYARLGDEDVENDLITLCRECHEAITSVIRRRRYAEKGPPSITYAVVPVLDPRLGAEDVVETIECETVRKDVTHAQRIVGGSFERILKGDVTNYVEKKQHDRR